MTDYIIKGIYDNIICTKFILFLSSLNADELSKELSKSSYDLDSSIYKSSDYYSKLTNLFYSFCCILFWIFKLIIYFYKF